MAFHGTGEFSFILKPSGIHGVGVFATHAIAEGARLRLFPESDAVRFLEGVPEEFERYVVAIESPQIMCPTDFGRMSIGWYVNHADEPNARIAGDYEYLAARDIGAGEEITIDYAKLEPTQARNGIEK